MTKVFNARTNKFAVVEKVDNGVYTLSFEDGTTKDIQETTFKTWYKPVGETEAPADAETTPEAPADAPADAPAEEDTVPAPADEAPADATPEAPEAEVDEKAIAKAKKDAEKAAKKVEADAKKAKLKADRDAAETARKAKKAELDAAKNAKTATPKKTDEEKATEKAKKKAEADAKKLAKEAEKAEKDDAPKTKAVDRIQDFFGVMMTKLQAKYPDLVGNQTNRKKNFRVFRFGIGNFRYSIRLSGNTVACSLVIKTDSAKVSTDLTKALEVYKAEIEAGLGYALVWESNPELKHSRIYTELKITNDAEATDWCVEKLKEFSTVITPFVEKIAQ